MGHLANDDAEIARIIRNEESRLENTLDLIAAENHAPKSILEAQGSVFSLKAAEGYPQNRFHAGCRYADELETLAVERAKQLFGAGHANVQPHSGVSANLAVYFSVLNTGDTIVSMKLSHGGHLSHGDPSSITSKCFDFRHYGVDAETEMIDYEMVQALAEQCKPAMIVAGASSYARLIDYEKLAEIAKGVSAYLLVDMAHIAGLVAAGVIPSPVQYADFITFTTYKTLRGGRGGVILCKAEHAKKIDRTIFPGGQGTTALNIMAAKAVCFKLAMEDNFKKLQEKTLQNAICFATQLEKKGYRIVSGRTENHLVLIDLRSKGITGHLAEKTLESVGIIVNRNVIPNDPEKPDIASGIRIGSPAITTRGLGEPAVKQIVEMIDTALVRRNHKEALERVCTEVLALCKKFPIPD
jgi:glycine hydroxymethyltransferase